MISSKANITQNRPVIFPNKRNAVQLLKKSLPSIGIDKKKEILSTLETLQREADTNDPELTKVHFKSLITAAIKCCLDLNEKSVIDHVLTLLHKKVKEDNNLAID